MPRGVQQRCVHDLCMASLSATPALPRSRLRLSNLHLTSFFLAAACPSTLRCQVRHSHQGLQLHDSHSDRSGRASRLCGHSSYGALPSNPKSASTCPGTPRTMHSLSSECTSLSLHAVYNMQKCGVGSVAVHDARIRVPHVSRRIDELFRDDDVYDACSEREVSDSFCTGSTSKKHADDMSSNSHAKKDDDHHNSIRNMHSQSNNNNNNKAHNRSKGDDAKDAMGDFYAVSELAGEGMGAIRTRYDDSAVCDDVSTGQTDMGDHAAELASSASVFAHIPHDAPHEVNLMVTSGAATMHAQNVAVDKWEVPSVGGADDSITYHTMRVGRDEEEKSSDACVGVDVLMETADISCTELICNEAAVSESMSLADSLATRNEADDDEEEEEMSLLDDEEEGVEEDGMPRSCREDGEAFCFFADSRARGVGVFSHRRATDGLGCGTQSALGGAPRAASGFDNCEIASAEMENVGEELPSPQRE